MILQSENVTYSSYLLIPEICSVLWLRSSLDLLWDLGKYGVQTGPYVSYPRRFV